MGGKARPHRYAIPDCPARSSVAIPTELPGPLINARYKTYTYDYFVDFIQVHAEAETFNYFTRAFGIYGAPLISRGIQITFLSPTM